MEVFLIICLIVVLIAFWIYFRERLREMEEQIAELARKVTAQGYRVPPPPRPMAVPAPPPPMPAVAVPPPVAPAPPVAVAGQAETPAPPAPPRQVEPVAAETATYEGVVGDAAAPRNWETIIGGNWLNKLGVFILVVGIALALGYSFAHVGPAGRVATSLVVSVAMLSAGVIVERRERYQIFARGLIGGGWAALYFTVYAMYAVDAARVLNDPFIAAVLLFVVAAGMIGHSLRYRSQTVTGLAYFVAFGTLAITEVTKFSVVALVPLAVSLLYLARRFEWPLFARLGLIATYGTCALRGDSGTPLWMAQIIFAIYWVIFEAFDLGSPDEWVLPLNTLGFLGLSLVKWEHAAPGQIWQLIAATAAAHLVSTVLRARSGRWGTAASFLAALAAWAVFLRAEIRWVPFWLLAEAELFYLAGVRFGAPYLRLLAGAVFGVELVQLGVEVASLEPVVWTPAAAVSAAVFYGNRALRTADTYYGYAGAAMLALIAGFRSPGDDRGLVWMLLAAPAFVLGRLRGLADFRFQAYGLGALGVAGMAAATAEPAYSLAIGAALAYGASLCGLRTDGFLDEEAEGLRLLGSMAGAGLMAAFLWRVVPDPYRGLAWVALAGALLELGMRGLPGELRKQSYAMAAVASGLLCYSNLLNLTNSGPWPPRLIPAAAGMLAYGFAARARKLAGGLVAAVAAGAGTFFVSLSIWASLPVDYVPPAWAVFGLVLLYAGLRWHSLALAGVAFAASWVGPSREVGMVVACLYAAHILTARGSRFKLVYSMLATLRLAALLYTEVSGSVLTMAWGAQGVLLLAAGFPLRDRVMRLSGLALLLGCIVKLFAYDLRNLETLPRIFSFIVLGLILVGVSWIYTRFREQVQRYL